MKFKAVALKELQLEEGVFWKGVEFYPGWKHDGFHKPVKRLFHIDPENRSRELEQTKCAVIERLDEDSSWPSLLATINLKRKELYSEDN